jgi:hypothetical protein
MGNPWRWCDGSSDPVDGARRNIDTVQQRNARELDFATSRSEAVLAPEYEITIYDPLQVMIDCEALDEAAEVPTGTHFNDYVRRNAKPTS